MSNTGLKVVFPKGLHDSTVEDIAFAVDDETMKDFQWDFINRILTISFADADDCRRGKIAVLSFVREMLDMHPKHIVSGNIIDYIIF